MKLRTALVVFVISTAFVSTAMNGQSPEPTRCLESEARPPVTSADLQIINRAKLILNSPGVWNRAEPYGDCPAGATTFSVYCALEKASDEVTGGHAHRQAALQEARFVIDEIARRAKDYDHRLTDYNNDPATTFADIERVFRLLESHISERLKEDEAQQQAEAARLAEYCAGIEVRIAKRVREILTSPRNWDRTNTQTCLPAAVTFSIYCAFEKATREVIGDFDGGGAAMNEARNLISETATNRDKYSSRLIDYNSDPTVTFDDVSNLLRIVEERITKR